MTPEMEALARRAVACKGWRWMPGMRFLTFDAGHRYACRVNESAILGQCIDPLPDLTDPATVGCLLALVRKAYRRPDIVTAYGMGVWAVRTCGTDNWIGFSEGSEAGALAAALEAAP